MKTPHIHHDVIVAWAADPTTKIQFRIPIAGRLDHQWQELDAADTPQWFEKIEYRIKPKFYDLKEAYAAGAKIQIKHWERDEWEDCVPQWATNREYRIKPKPNLVVNAMMKFDHDFKSPYVYSSWNGEQPAGYKHQNDMPELTLVQFIFDGETNELIKVEKLS